MFFTGNRCFSEIQATSVPFKASVMASGCYSVVDYLYQIGENFEMSNTTRVHVVYTNLNINILQTIIHFLLIELIYQPSQRWTTAH